MCLAAGVPAGSWIHSHNYLNATPRDIAAGSIHGNRAGTDDTVMLLGDSIACMYGTAIRDACEVENRRLTVMSIAGQNPLIATPDDTTPLWQHTLAAVRDTRPEVIVIGCRWDLHLRDQPMFFTLLLGALRPYATTIGLIDAVPQLPVDGIRAAMRAGSRPPFHEPEEEYARREATNRAVAACAGPAVRIIEASRRFSRPDREVVAFDARGRCLYQDGGHVSTWGASLLTEDFRREIQGVSSRPR